MTPEDLDRAAYREVSRQLRIRGERPAFEIFDAARAALSMPEERCRVDIYAAMVTMIRAGLVACNTIDVDRNVHFNSSTVLTPLFPRLH